MSNETSQSRDPRTRLVREKYFTLRPKPLERWLWQQGLPQAAERIFWLHWEEGMRAGDWCSQLPLKRVAAECCVDPSTVTRAYQVLKRLGLIVRQDPGRDEANPFQQATAITEVRIPRALLTELHRAPNRQTRSSPSPAPAPARPAPAAPPTAPLRTVPPASAAPPDRRLVQTAMAKLSAEERRRFYEASNAYRTHLEFDPRTALDPAERAAVLASLDSFATRRPQVVAPVAAQVPPDRPRPLTQLELARTRKRLRESLPPQAVDGVLREIAWSVEQGTLARFGAAKGLNVALKLVREGQWSRPNRMPPNWQRRLSFPEACIGA